MKFFLVGLLFSFTILNAGLVNAIAIIVNDEPITLYDIDKQMQLKKVSKQQAIKSLIDEKIYNQQLKKNNITVDIFDVDDQIEKIAARNNMNVLDFKSLVRQQQNFDTFKEQIKKQLLHQRLIRKISGGKLKVASDADMKIFYENNKEQYEIANTIDVTAYISKDKNSLNQIKRNPMMQNDNVKFQDITLKQSELSAQAKYILNLTKEKTFSAVFAQNKNYNMFFVKKKKDVKVLSFEDVKDQIFQTIMKKREQSFLQEYFETLKITADIKVLR